MYSILIKISEFGFQSLIFCVSLFLVLSSKPQNSSQPKIPSRPFVLERVRRFKTVKTIYKMAVRQRSQRIINFGTDSLNLFNTGPFGFRVKDDDTKIFNGKIFWPEILEHGSISKYQNLVRVSPMKILIQKFDVDDQLKNYPVQSFSRRIIV